MSCPTFHPFPLPLFLVWPHLFMPRIPHVSPSPMIWNCPFGRAACSSAWVPSYPSSPMMPPPLPVAHSLLLGPNVECAPESLLLSWLLRGGVMDHPAFQWLEGLSYHPGFQFARCPCPSCVVSFHPLVPVPRQMLKSTPVSFQNQSSADF